MDTLSRDESYLFRWAGSHIEPRLKYTTGKLPRITSIVRTKYLQMLGETLEHGLYARIPANDGLGDGNIIKLNRPCLCFTELCLGESRQHWREYGRMAFGFTKAFVAREGGGTVSYINGAQNHPVVKSLERLHSRFQGAGRREDKDALNLLWHFFKRMKDAPRPASKAKSKGAADTKPKKKLQLPPEEEAARNARFPAVMPLPYLDEYEWRLIYSQTERWKPLDAGLPPKEALFVVKPGSEMQVIVVPDNNTVQQALECPEIKAKLFPKDGRTPVQLLSLEAIVRL